MIFDEYLNRGDVRSQLKTLMIDFDKNKHDILYKRGIYVYGQPGVGKTYLVNSVLSEMGYDIIRYDAVENRSDIITSITKDEITDMNVISCFYKKKQKIAIIVTEMDSMAANDKSVLDDLIKLIKPKKKPKKEEKPDKPTLVPIICIGQQSTNKKIHDLCKGCNVIEIIKPHNSEIENIIKSFFHNIVDNPSKIQSLTEFINGNLHILKNIYKINETSPELIENYNLPSLIQFKTSNIDINNVIHMLMKSKYKIEEHLEIINEPDRTIVAHLWHENIVDAISSVPKSISIPFYLYQLKNICFSDYIYRVAFQKQIWQFNEMSSLIKTFKNNTHYMDTFPNNEKNIPKDIRFTKILTKFATEHGNINFIHRLCNTLNMDKRDMISFFKRLQTNSQRANIEIELLELYDITALDIKRINTYISKIS